MRGNYIVAASVEDALRHAGRPLTFDEVQKALPRRRRLAGALSAAIKMGHVKRRGLIPDETYEYIQPENRR